MEPATNPVDVIQLAHPSISSKNVEQFKEEMAAHVAPGRRLVLDMRLVNYLDSSGCGALVNLSRKLSLGGGRLKLCCVTPSVRALFDLVRLHLVLDIYATCAEAVQSFNEEATV